MNTSGYQSYSPAADALADTCSDLAQQLHDQLNAAGFEVDGVEVEPDGEHELLISVPRFPSILLTKESRRGWEYELISEWVNEVSCKLVDVTLPKE